MSTAQLTHHAAPPRHVTPPMTHAHAPMGGGLLLFIVGAPVSFALVLSAIIYVSRMGF